MIRANPIDIGLQTSHSGDKSNEETLNMLKIKQLKKQ